MMQLFEILLPVNLVDGNLHGASEAIRNALGQNQKLKED